MAERNFARNPVAIIRQLSCRFREQEGGRLALVRDKAHDLSRWVYLVAQGFLRDQCMIRASALTFTTILAIVPLLAVVFSISKGFGLQNTEFIRGLLLRITADKAEVADKILQYIGNTNVKTLGWLGVVTLLVTVFTTVGTVERAFNTIWGVTRGRTAWRKFTDFFSIILVCPILMFAATSFTVTLHKQEFIKDILSISAFGYLEALLLKLLPFVLVWFGFVFMYTFIPNTRVKLGSAAVGGLVGGALWQTAQWVYIGWQIGVVKYNAIYGSFAQLPLLLVWLYISWLIVLLGAEMCHATQHFHSLAGQAFAGAVSHAQRQRLALRMLLLLTWRFKHGLPPASLDEVAHGAGAPRALVADLFETLCGAGIAVQAGDNDQRVYSPAVEPGLIRVADVLKALSEAGGPQGCGTTDDGLGLADEILAGLAKAASESPANLSLAEWAGRLPAPEKVEAPETAPAAGQG